MGCFWITLWALWLRAGYSLALGISGVTQSGARVVLFTLSSLAYSLWMAYLNSWVDGSVGLWGYLPRMQLLIYFLQLLLLDLQVRQGILQMDGSLRIVCSILAPLPSFASAIYLSTKRKASDGMEPEQSSSETVDAIAAGAAAAPTAVVPNHEATPDSSPDCSPRIDISEDAAMKPVSFRSTGSAEILPADTEEPDLLRMVIRVAAPLVAQCVGAVLATGVSCAVSRISGFIAVSSEYCDDRGSFSQVLQDAAPSWIVSMVALCCLVRRGVPIVHFFLLVDSFILVTMVFAVYLGVALVFLTSAITV